MKNKYLSIIISCIMIVSLNTNAQYQTTGDASSIPDFYCNTGDWFEITPSNAWKSGAVWNETLLDLTKPFSICFHAYFGINDAAADGMAFVLQTDPRGSAALGGRGGYLGYSERNPDNIGDPGYKINPSLAVEFDTYDNDGQHSIVDYSVDHISIVRNGDLTNQPLITVPALYSSGNIEDGLCHSIRITWNPDTKELSVSFDDEGSVFYIIDLVNNVFRGENEVMWGITGATGTFFNRQLVGIESVYNSDLYATVGHATPYCFDCGNECFRLTADVQDASGAIWNNTKVDLSKCFRICYTANFGDKDKNGADGINFVLQNDPAGTSAIGNTGGGIGYQGISPSIAVEFDTYYNQHHPYLDPVEDHAEIIINGQMDNSSDRYILENLEDDTCYNICVEWNPISQRLRVVFEGDTIINKNIDLINTVFDGVTNVYWGFTSATGDWKNRHVVCIESFESFDCMTDCCDDFHFKVEYGCTGNALAYFDGDMEKCDYPYVSIVGFDEEKVDSDVRKTGYFTLYPGETRIIEAYLISTSGDTLCKESGTVDCNAVVICCDGLVVREMQSITQPGYYDLYLHQNPYIPCLVYAVRVNGIITLDGYGSPLTIPLPWNTGLLIGSVNPVLYPVSNIEFLDYENYVLCMESISLAPILPKMAVLANKNSNLNLKLIPNPASYQTELSFYLNTADEVNIKVTDITGRKIMYQKVYQLDSGQQKLILQTHNLSNGLHMLIISTRYETTLEKLVIQK
jgi:lectin family protein/type IX secretion system substrate protein